ncbi:hypothetical protein ACLMJK_007741 [Lecanora helva]
MLDPLTALSLASAIVQITDFGCKLVSQSQEIYKSANGALKDNVTIEEIVKDISDLYDGLRRNDSAFQRSSADDLALGNLADKCTEVAGELLDLLTSLKAPPGASHWKTFRIAIRNALKQSKVRDMEARLIKIQRQIDRHLHKMVADQQSWLCVRINDISKEHTRMQLESIHHMEQLKGEIRVATAQSAEHRAENTDYSQNLVHKLESLAADGQRVATEERILRSLEFDEWTRRFNDVRKAHPQTFDWMLNDSDDPLIPPTGFKHWLHSSESIFWISGKPGSGKSTLMKFLSGHPQVRQHLMNWTGEEADPTMISWFFWAAGSPMQRSKEGLFQSLLFQVLRRCPQLIPIICAERWADQSEYVKKSDPWSLDELDVAFEILAQQRIPGKRFCIFIDGLDEYEGLPADIIRRLQSLSKSENIKLCLSSRPWTAFETAFRDVKSISLQDHTKRDIERFVRDILEKDESFSQAELRDKRYNAFVHRVIGRAQGVFLWVYLVVNELLKGLSEENKLEDLEDKLDTLPDSLEEYFRRIFNGVDRPHRTESAKVFLITAHAVAPPPLVCYHFLENEHRSPGYALKAKIRPFTPKESTQLDKDVCNRLNFLCRNLLEVNEVDVDQMRGFQVDFIHRTVRDFLMTKDMHEILIQRATENGKTKWSGHVALCHVLLARIKSLGLHDGIRNNLNALFTVVDTIMFHAQEVENEERSPQTKVLNQIDEVISSFADADMVYHWTNARDPPKGARYFEDHRNSFLGLAIQNRLTLYVQQALDSNPQLLRSKKGRPLLDYALRPKMVTPTMLPQPVEHINFEMVRMLLDKGGDPNQKISLYGNLTVWGLFLLSCYEMKDIENSQAKDTWFKAAELMIRKGADKHLRVETKRWEGTKATPDQISYTAKYRRPVQQTPDIPVEVPVELTALDIMEEIFATNKIAEIEAIVPEARAWTVWSWFRWS